MDERRSGPQTVKRGVTLNTLKERLHTLNMRMLLAMQNHDGETQEELRKHIAALQEEISRMCEGGGYRR